MFIWKDIKSIFYVKARIIIKKGLGNLTHQKSEKKTLNVIQKIIQCILKIKDPNIRDALDHE